MVRLAASGLTDKEIARHLKISPASVNTYWVRCREKLGVGSRAACVAIVLSNQQDTHRPSHWELRWTALFEATSQCVMVVDQHHVVRMVNEAFLKTLNMAESDIVGQAVPRGGDEVYDEHGRRLAPNELPIARCYETGMPSCDVIRVVLPSAPPLWLRVWVRPLIYSEDLPSEVLAVLEPIDPPTNAP